MLDDLYQSGCSKIRLPRRLSNERRDKCDAEAVLINTSGGLADGDCLNTKITWQNGTRAHVTSQAAERVYRARSLTSAPACVTTSLHVGKAALACWLPQETILFDGGRFARAITANVAAGGLLLACESLVFGRTAMGERVHSGAFCDAWQISYDGALVFADRQAGEGDMAALLARPAVGGGAAAIGSILVVGARCEDLAQPLRDCCEKIDARVGISCRDHVVVVRLLGADGLQLRTGLMVLLNEILQQLDSSELGRSWYC